MKIHDGIPLPPIKARPHKAVYFPFMTMKPGQMVYVDWRDYSAAKSHAQRSGRKRGNVKFESRMLENGYGFWCQGPSFGTIIHEC